LMAQRQVLQLHGSTGAEDRPQGGEQCGQNEHRSRRYAESCNRHYPKEIGISGMHRYLSGTVGKKMALAVTSAKDEDGERNYSIDSRLKCLGFAARVPNSAAFLVCPRNPTGSEDCQGLIKIPLLRQYLSRDYPPLGIAFGGFFGFSIGTGFSG